jgi:hypothetical protein
VLGGQRQFATGELLGPGRSFPNGATLLGLLVVLENGDCHIGRMET